TTSMLVAGSRAQAAEGATAKPNIVVMLVDDMGVMDTSVPFLTDAAGQPKRYPLNDYYRTPNMERLAQRGIRFNNFNAMSFGAPASYYGMQNYGNEGGDVKKQSPAAVPGLQKYHGTDTFLTDALVLEAKSHVAEAVGMKKPFYLYFASYAVHAPFNSDPRFAA